MILHRNLMKLEKAFTREHMEALLPWNYILSQSWLQMNIFWLLTQSTHRTGAGNKCAVWTVLYTLTQVPVCKWWHLRNIRKKKISGCDLTQIIKLADNQILKWVCLDNQSCSICFWLTEKRNFCVPTNSQIPSATNNTIKNQFILKDFLKSRCEKKCPFLALMPLFGH